MFLQNVCHSFESLTKEEQEIYIDMLSNVAISSEEFFDSLFLWRREFTIQNIPQKRSFLQAL